MGSSRARSSSNRDGQEELYCKISIGASALALLSFVVLMFVPAPYGRYVRPRWGPLISARVGWIAMEMPAVLVFAWAFFAGERWFHPAPLVLFTLWETHYVHRAFVYPFRTHGGKPMTLLVAAFVALCVTAPYGYLNGRQLSHFGEYPTSWLVDPRFIVGCTLFIVGFVINFQSDTILTRLRKPGETGHKLPRGGLFRWVSSPNYFGELVEWSGGRSQPGRWLAWPLRFGERLTLCRVHWRIIVGVARNSQTIYVNGGL